MVDGFVEASLAVDDELSEDEAGEGLSDGTNLVNGIRLCGSVREDALVAVLEDAYGDSSGFAGGEAAEFQDWFEVAAENGFKVCYDEGRERGVVGDAGGDHCIMRMIEDERPDESGGNVKSDDDDA